MKLGFIGCGRMGSALVQGVLKARFVSAADIYVTDKIEVAAQKIITETGVLHARNSAALAAEADVILLCVKPADAAEALHEAHAELSAKLLISIVAGMTLETLRRAAGDDVRIARVMPNTPALIHRGAAAYSLSANSREEDIAIVERIFSAVGVIYRVDETLLDAVTGLSGSGPAYIYVAIEALADAGATMGLPHDLALQLAAQTTAGAAEMVLQTGMQPAQLREMVASPGGTTIAGLEKLEAAGFRTALSEAVRAATDRSRELGSAK